VPTVLDVVGVAADVVNLHEAEGAVLEAPDSPLFVRADRTRLTRALNNLIRNALESNGGNHVDVGIRVRSENDTVYVEVWDRGLGIEQGRLARIFEPKFTTKTHGLGLGLAMVQAIVKGAKGAIRVESDGATGTTFILSLPLIDKA